MTRVGVRVRFRFRARVRVRVRARVRFRASVRARVRGTQEEDMGGPQWAGNPTCWHSCQRRFFAKAKRTTTNRQQKL